VTAIRRHPLAAYCVLAYAISWLLVSPLVAAAWGLLPIHPAPAWHALGAIGPIAAALIVTAIVGGKWGLRPFATRLVRWRVAPGWCLLALSPLPLFAFSALALHIATGHWPGFGHIWHDPALVLSWGAGFAYGIGEEPGWRGFALPRLQERHNALAASLLLAAIWIGWHAAYFTYRFQPGVSQFIGFAIGLAAGAVLLTCLYNGSGGSVLLAIVYHATLNAVYDPAVASPGILAIMTTAIIAGALLIVVIFGPATLAPHRRGRKRPAPAVVGR
jgi:membrane protease YdiL (CAAX protease family)